MNIKHIFVSAILALSLFSNQSYSHSFTPSEIVSSVDWKNMQVVEVVLNEYSITPSSLAFKKNVPYKLIVKNIGKGKHYFTAKDFFHSIATRKVQSNHDGEIKADFFNALEVYPGKSLDLYFVPVVKGVYGSACTISGHKESGMSGTITIE